MPTCIKKKRQGFLFSRGASPQKAGIAHAGLERRMEEKKYQTDSACDKSKHIKGVLCDVKNCTYHNGKSECCAGCISVGPSHAESSSGTACATFKPKAY